MATSKCRLTSSDQPREAPAYRETTWAKRMIQMAAPMTNSAFSATMLIAWLARCSADIVLPSRRLEMD